MVSDNNEIDKVIACDILTPEETAIYLRKSTSWVYKNWKILGGRKLGGSLFFPRKENLYEHLFSQGKGVEVRLHPERDQAHGNLVQNKKRGDACGSKEKGGTEQSGITNTDPNRHGILEVGKQKA